MAPVNNSPFILIQPSTLFHSSIIQPSTHFHQHRDGDTGTKVVDLNLELINLRNNGNGESSRHSVSSFSHCSIHSCMLFLSVGCCHLPCYGICEVTPHQWETSLWDEKHFPWKKNLSFISSKGKLEVSKHLAINFRVARNILYVAFLLL